MKPHLRKSCVLLSNSVRPWPAGLFVPYEEIQSIQSRRLNCYCPPLRQEGEAPSGKREVAAVGDWQFFTNPFFAQSPFPNQMIALHSFKCHPGFFWVIYLLVVNLTFSSIPPLMTGSGSGPVGMKMTQEWVTDSTNTTLSLSVRTNLTTQLDQESFCSSPFIPPTPTSIT